MRLRELCAVTVLGFAGFSQFAFAEPDAAGPASAGDRGAIFDRVNVKELREKYWERGDTGDVRVIQNRLYKKALRFELGAFAGKMSSDPFLSISQVGGSFAFHFSEYVGLGVLAWKSSTKPSSALTFLEETTHKSAVTNPPQSFFGGELQLSPIYGKLSLFGLAIIHYDVHFLGGAGRMSTNSGQYIAPTVGIGQELYLGKYGAFRLDYRYLWYTETISAAGDPVALSRSASGDVVTLGFSLLFGFWD
ncbi:MAG: hypothetical protein A2428_12890 [Bdellovibrionales bacterium RIFOXYC1_FULL_54_43]|nr:MAG: hypothetical protein A2428_12890 [Bdellovibrionales bacterium RIFOXYC1_FULL_54_43]OFZ83102.1 MAG: hypothetical protein A2603_05600 [Bdellovibrionales bacterium RIFOXYD1_FULL_55_31]